MSNQNTSRKDAPPEMEDALILEAMKGNPPALAAVYDFYARRIYRYFYSRVENSEEADELTAQTFLSVIEALPRYQHRGHFTAWIFQVARSKAMDFFRRDHSKVQKEADLSGIVFDETLEKVIQGQTVETLRRMIQLLDEDERELLRLRFVVDLSYVEIAELLGRKDDAVRKSVKRIIEHLYVQMEVEHVQA